MAVVPVLLDAAWLLGKGELRGVSESEQWVCVETWVTCSLDALLSGSFIETGPDDEVVEKLDSISVQWGALVITVALQQSPAEVDALNGERCDSSDAGEEVKSEQPTS